MLKKYHYAFGCYGIIGNQSELVVIKKHGGPYTNRYDLPGGSLEDGESLNHAVLREVKEETGLMALTYHQIGVTSFKYPWNYQQWQYNQHICVFYEIKKVTGKIARQVEQFAGQDSLGAILVPLACLDINNSSPLVLKAKEFLLNPLTFNLDDQIFKSWKVLDKPAF
ncbi:MULTISPECIES: NUDIX hydrolase [unclassified Lactobacillus]|uniref:NUDIX hydrolase n=1 Tax=unclassified Lactobacillus TaxID=2620435 RepID=UPI000EFB6BF4|nr:MULTISPECIES: NUDIX hydrolase [unclassified Lactobacillus]RMC24369.1 NUDIX domain-containing protein [Lactobacillus sp. ESL0247]RMC28508.1 NUDIX domain-containing protein [Lactobacillus sp. ESL0246]RMC31699.1 NUDIX domain-containing protein [Lactobacillus sp. ESL0245]